MLLMLVSAATAMRVSAPDAGPNWEDLVYVMRFDREAYIGRLKEGAEIIDEGMERAFEVAVDASEGCVFFWKSLSLRC